MSYLLKALAKAEQERQQQKQGDQSTAQVLMVESKLPKSLLFVVFLLVAATIWQLIPKESATEETMLTQTEPHSVNEQQAQIKSVSNEKSTKPVKQTLQPQSQKAKDLYELSAAELARIPSLELASHIYSSAPNFRSVVINGQTYEEGMLIKAGVILDEIIPSGIVIDVQGQKVELPKGISWIASQNVE